MSDAQLKGGRAEGLLCPILKIKKKCPDLLKNALTVYILELNFQHNRVLLKKNISVQFL